MNLTPGMQLRSIDCPTKVVVVKAPASQVALACGGHLMVLTPDDAATSDAVTAPDGEPPLLGKRYVDDALGLEVLCVSAGTGTLSVDGRLLTTKAAKPLPSSD